MAGGRGKNKRPFDRIATVATSQATGRASPPPLVPLNVKPENVNQDQEPDDQIDASMTDYSAEQLIEEVRARPSLYDKSVPEYIDREAKDRSWEQICRALDPTWDEHEDADRIRITSNIQKKWRNIRDNYKKDIRMQNNPNPSKRKRRKYIYCDQLGFLIPFLDETLKFQNGKKVESALKINRHNQNNTNANSDDTNLQKRIDDDENDEDKFFLLSLVSSFKKLSDEKKLFAKSKFLNILMQLHFPCKYRQNILDE